MKYIYTVFVASLLLGCHKDNTVNHPFIDINWGKSQILHVPDNVGFYTIYISTYRFGADGTYSVDGAYPIVAKWTWLEEGRRLKIDYKGKTNYNDVVTILTASDTLLHITKRIEGEPDNTGNYWEIKYRQ